MLYFYMAALVVVVLAVLAYFLIRAQTAQEQAGLNARQKRYQVHEHAVLELLQAKERGEIDAETYEWELQQLNQRLVQEMTDLEAFAPRQTPTAKRYLKPWLALLVIVPLLAASMYFYLGQSVPDPAQVLLRTGDVGQFLDQIQSLEAKVEEDPDNLIQQLMLARSYRVMGRHAEAVIAYGKAWPLIEENPSELALFAEVLALQRGSFEGKPDELLLQAQTLEADNLDVLMLMAESAVEKKHYKEALMLLESLRESLVAEGEEVDWLDERVEILEEVLAK